MVGKLSVVATPIGNLGDITFRALWTLKECAVIYAEDTRVTLKLLTHYGLHKPLHRLDDATEDRKSPEIIERLLKGEHVALVSDAGTPAISDPGARLIARVREAGITIEAIPGPSAVVAALSIAGIRGDRFIFLGFLPHKKGRHTAILGIGKSSIPVVLYESPHRVLKLLKEIHGVAPQCTVTIVREVTKLYEEVIVGTPHDVGKCLETGKRARGEFVVIFEPRSYYKNV